jgi:hypothetical protein
MSEHEKYVYSITVHSEDLAVVNCLRALSQFSQKSGNNRIPWGGTKDSDWKRDNHQVVFHFSCPDYRNGFKAEVRRLLPKDCCSFVSERDDDPAHKVSR